MSLTPDLTTTRPPYFDDAHNALSSRADELLQDKWTEEDTDQFLIEIDSFTAFNYNLEKDDFLQAMEECADEYITDKTAFPEDLELQRQVVQSDITESELKLFVTLSDGLDGVVDSDQKLDHFIGTIRNGSPSVYNGDCRTGEVSETIQNFAESLHRSEVSTLMQNSGMENTFAERMAAAEVLSKNGAYGSAREAALTGSDDLINAINNGEVTTEEQYDTFIDLEPTLSELGYEGNELTDAIATISTSAGSQIVKSSLENGLITSREILDGLLTSQGTKPPTARTRI